MNRQRLWFIVKEGVCRERSTDVHDEVVYGTMSGVHDVGLVLNQVVDTLYDAPLSEHDFVPHGHETVLHVSPQSVHEIIEEIVVLEIGKRAKMVADKNGHDFTEAQSSFSITVRVFLVFQTKIFLTFGCKIIAKFIHDTENLYNFVFGNHRLYSF